MGNESILESIIFYFFAFVVIGSAMIVVFSRNIMYSAFSLLFTFFGVAGLYVLLMADFIAVTQIMIYIGGILILIIFGVMLTSKVISVDIKTGPTGKTTVWAAGILSLIIAVSLSLLYTNATWVTGNYFEVETSIDAIGIVLLTEYVLAFEVAAILLLVALIGAALIARRR